MGDISPAPSVRVIIPLAPALNMMLDAELLSPFTVDVKVIGAEEPFKSVLITALFQLMTVGPLKTTNPPVVSITELS